jgi:four helix bundle protein
MASYASFEELEVWKLGMDLCASIYSITNQDNFAKDFGLKDQIRRCSVSIPSNISEGFERDSKNQFIYFLIIAKGSCGELKTQLMIAKNLNYIDQLTFNNLMEKVNVTGKQLGGFIKYLRNFEGKK